VGPGQRHPAERPGRPPDPGHLAASGPRYLSPDSEFAVWSATLGEESDGEAVSIVGPLGHVRAGAQLVCAGAFSEHARHGWRFEVETFHSTLPQSPRASRSG